MIRPLMHHVLSGQPLNKIKVGEDIENPSIRDCVYFSGIAFLSFPESYAAIFIAGIACETLGLLLAVIGAVKKEPKDSL